MLCSLALLCDRELALSRHAPLLLELGPEADGLLLAAPELTSTLLAEAAIQLPRAVRRVASLHPRAGLVGALQAALLACSSPALLAIDANEPPPPLEELRRLLSDPGPANALVFERQGRLAALPGRYRRGCLGPLARAVLDGQRELAPLLRRLRCSRLQLQGLSLIH